MVQVEKKDLTQEELNSLYPTFGLLTDVNFDKIEYYKENNNLYEISVCTDGSVNKRLKQLKRFQKTKNLLKCFGL